MLLKHDVNVLVTDGRKMLLFQNVGDADQPHLEAVTVREQSNPADREYKSDAPGRTFSSSQHGAGRSAYSETDYHDLEEDLFARRTAELLKARAARGDLQSLVIVADPRTLGELRKHYDTRILDCLVGEVAADLVKHPVSAIEKILLNR